MVCTLYYTPYVAPFGPVHPTSAKVSGRWMVQNARGLRPYSLFEKAFLQRELTTTTWSIVHLTVKCVSLPIPFLHKGHKHSPSHLYGQFKVRGLRSTNFNFKHWIKLFLDKSLMSQLSSLANSLMQYSTTHWYILNRKRNVRCMWRINMFICKCLYIWLGTSEKISFLLTS